MFEFNQVLFGPDLIAKLFIIHYKGSKPYIFITIPTIIKCYFTDDIIHVSIMMYAADSSL